MTTRRSVARLRQWASYFGAAALSVACSNPHHNAPQPLQDIDRALRVADALEIEHAYDPARRQLRAALPYATEDQRPALRLRICALYEMAGDIADALRCYGDLQQSESNQEIAQLAAFRDVRLRLQSSADEALLRRLESIVLALPGSDASHRAFVLRRNLAHESAGDAGETAFLQAIEKRLREDGEDAQEPTQGRRRMRAEALVLTAKIFIDRMQQPARAVELLEGRQEVWRKTVWADDALFAWARAERALKNYDAAIARYQALIDSRESSWWMGSYNSENLDDAYFELAECWEQLGRVTKAIRAFEKMIDNNPNSRLVDDAAFARARLLWDLGKRDAMEAFVDDYPESRHLKKARRTLAAP